MIIEYSKELNKFYCYFDKLEQIPVLKFIIPSSKKEEMTNDKVIFSGTPYLLPIQIYKKEKELVIKCIHNKNYLTNKFRRLPRQDFIDALDSCTCHIPIPKEKLVLKEDFIFLSDFYFLINENFLPLCCKSKKVFFNEALTNLNHKKLIFDFLFNSFFYKEFLIIKKEINYEIKFFHNTFLCKEIKELNEEYEFMNKNNEIKNINEFSSVYNKSLFMTKGIKVGIKKSDMIIRNKECFNDYFMDLIYDFVKECSLGCFIDDYELSIIYDVTVF